MAKKVRVSSPHSGNVVKKGVPQQKEETYEFVPTEFDERTHIKKEITGTKVTLIFALTSLIVGFAAGCLHTLTDSAIWGVVVVVVVFAGMTQFLKLIGIDTTKIKAGSMLGNYITSIFLILCVWTLMINPPFI
jgi:hypothetical protein